MIFGSTMLEVAIGLAFIYLLLSLLCSAAGEYIEAKLNNRAKYLRQGIVLLLNESRGGGIDLAQQLYDHGLVRPLYRGPDKLPSYIPSRTFALALWNIATTAGAPSGTALDQVTVAGVTNDLRQIREVVATQLPNPELRTAILTLIDEANGDLERARRNIEDWYNSMMERVSGWYKRRTTVLMLALGCLLAAGVNADTVTIATALSNDAALRSAVVSAAEQRAATPLPTPVTDGTDPAARDRAATDSLIQGRVAVESLGLPLGWVGANGPNTGDPRRMPGTAQGWLLKVLGILLTGLAISQGSPFWFDLLNKFIIIRSTVKPPEPKDGERS
jgi:hypothetical protein